MIITKRQMLSQTGTAKVNEDAANIASCGAWVLDGATGLNGKNIIDKISDTRWFVRWWDSYLVNNITRDLPLKEIVREGILKVRAEFYNLTEGSLPMDIDIPSSTIVLVRWNKEQIEYFCLGDSLLAVRDNVSKRIIQDERLKTLDESIFRSMARLMAEKELDLMEAKDELMDSIIENRLRKNKEDGYWILSLDEAAADNGLYGTIGVSGEASLLLATDGFSSISEKYKCLPLDKLIDEVESQGMEAIYKKIRSVEERDRFGRMFPRFKQSDDASAVFLALRTAQ